MRKVSLVKMGFRSLIALLLINASTSSAISQSVFLFSPNNATAMQIQNEAIELCPTLEIQVFGHSKDFWDFFETQKPDAVISTELVFKNIVGYKIALLGKYKGKTEENYSLISISDSFDFTDTKGIKVGVLNEASRQILTDYYSELLGQSIRINPVSKPRDLMPLLNFNMVQFLVVRDSILEYIKSSTTQKIFTKPLKTATSLKLVAIGNEVDDVISKSITFCASNFSAKVNSYMGVDQWTQP